MTRIAGVRTVLLSGPCTHDPWLRTFRPLRSVALVEIRTDDGVTGVGETYAGYFFPESVPLVVDYLADVITGAEPIEDAATWDVRALTARMRTCIAYWGRVGLGAAVIAGIEGALWDLNGKLLNVPVHRLLSPDSPARLPVYATGGPSPWPDAQLVAKASSYADQGFRTIKVSTGSLDLTDGSEVPTRDPVRAEVAKLDLLGREVPDVAVALDAHMGHRVGPDRWDTTTAGSVLAALGGRGVPFVEEPLPYDDLAGYAELRRGSAVPVAGGEQLSASAEFEPFAAASAFDIVQPDASWVGISAYLQVAARFDRSAPHSWSAGVGMMQNLHAAFASPSTVIAEMVPSPGPLHTELWGDSVRLVDSQVLRPDAPGLGVHLTPEIERAFPFRPGCEEFAGVPGKRLPPPVPVEELRWPT